MFTEPKIPKAVQEKEWKRKRRFHVRGTLVKGHSRRIPLGSRERTVTVSASELLGKLDVLDTRESRYFTQIRRVFPASEPQGGTHEKHKILGRKTGALRVVRGRPMELSGLEGEEIGGGREK